MITFVISGSADDETGTKSYDQNIFAHCLLNRMFFDVGEKNTF